MVDGSWYDSDERASLSAAVESAVADATVRAWVVIADAVTEDGSTFAVVLNSGDRTREELSELLRRGLSFLDRAND